MKSEDYFYYFLYWTRTLVSCIIGIVGSAFILLLVAYVLIHIFRLQENFFEKIFIMLAAGCCINALITSAFVRPLLSFNDYVEEYRIKESMLHVSFWIGLIIWVIVSFFFVGEMFDTRDMEIVTEYRDWYMGLVLLYSIVRAGIGCYYLNEEREELKELKRYNRLK